MNWFGRWATTLATTGALMVAGTGVALADTGTPTPQPGPITLTPQESAYVCGTRIPNALTRIDALRTRAAGDATTVGSTAWLQAKEDAATAAGRQDRAAALQKRIDARPDELAKLADAQQRLEAFRKEHCG